MQIEIAITLKSETQPQPEPLKSSQPVFPRLSMTPGVCVLTGKPKIGKTREALHQAGEAASRGSIIHYQPFEGTYLNPVVLLSQLLALPNPRQVPRIVIFDGVTNPHELGEHLKLCAENNGVIVWLIAQISKQDCAPENNNGEPTLSIL